MNVLEQCTRNLDARNANFINIEGNQIVHNHSPEVGLNPNSISARFDSHDREQCLDGTRVEILAGLDHWMDDKAFVAHCCPIYLTKSSTYSPLVPPIYWINGLAGTGKTTISFTFAHRCKKIDNLQLSVLASFVPAKTPTAAIPNLCFAHIADQLGRFCQAFGVLVADAYSKDPGLQNSSVSNLLEELIVKPLGKVRHKFPPSPCIIILDALDECRFDQRRPNECRDDILGGTTHIILSSLSRFIGSLAPLKFLITSRPLHGISNSFQEDSLKNAFWCLL